MSEQINPWFWIEAIRIAMHVTDCPEKVQTLTNAADHLERYIRSLRQEGITAAWVIGYLPAKILAPYGNVSQDYIDGHNDGTRLSREEVAHAFAEWHELNPAPPTSGAYSGLCPCCGELECDKEDATPAQAGAELPEPCKHKWRNSDRHDPMLPSTWVQQCTKFGAYDDDE